MLRHHALCLVAFLSNTLPMALTGTLFCFGGLANADWALSVGISALILCIASAALSHWKLRDAPILWLPTLLLAGISKGGFLATILHHTGLLEGLSWSDWITGLLISLLLTLGTLLLCLAALHLPQVSRHPQWWMLPVLAILLIAAIVLLIVYHNACFTLLLLNTLTLLFCFVARILEFDESVELRNYLLVASLVYALFLLFVALFIISMADGDCDADCCDCCDCPESDRKSAQKAKAKK